jgi:hypothetical protein
MYMRVREHFFFWDVHRNSMMNGVISLINCSSRVLINLALHSAAENLSFKRFVSETSQSVCIYSFTGV